ncbi:hypothetical protein FR483_n681L [Paramecium bursaria Chlorella virus FR483]|uniref:Uncharacterized protein n681L n=1 Tax=Paramecium bursaria Chlorella virus FR483 TaxID=399781 RepID=A7J835_PBCVF|nr:hypothetical protein FR483_n681L [Paramecium bursaria Chlorella virus FR483]ABT15966.1 hypothetical protein FR483_n681L [Paramecium bursaria Chlorella virus FR483]
MGGATFQLVARELASALDNFAIHHQSGAISIKGVFETFELSISCYSGICFWDFGWGRECRRYAVSHAKSSEHSRV